MLRVLALRLRPRLLSSPKVVLLGVGLHCRAPSHCFASLALRNSPDADPFNHEHDSDTRAVESDMPENKKYTAHIHKLALRGQWLDAKKMFDSIEVKNTILYNVIISGADKNRKYEEGLQLFSDMEVHGIKRSGVSYASALTILGRQGKASEALELWEGMHTSDVRATPACLTGLLNAFAASGDIAGVEARIEEAKAQGYEVNVHHLGVLMKACVHGGDAERSVKIMQDIRASGLQLLPVHYTLAMSACARAAELEAFTQTEVERHIGDLTEQLANDGVRMDALFLEEHVRALTGGTKLQDVSWSSVPVEVAREACDVLDEAEREGVRMTKLLRQIESHIRERSRMSLIQTDDRVSASPFKKAGR